MRLVLMALLLAPTLLSAQSLPEKSPRWHVLVEDKSAPVWIDSETIRKNGSRVLVWLRIEYKVPDKDNPKLKMSLGRWEHDCDNDRIRILEMTNYDAQGKVLDTHSEKLPLESDWVRLPPESMGEAIHQAVCKMERAQTGGSAASPEFMLHPPPAPSGVREKTITVRLHIDASGVVRDAEIIPSTGDRKYDAELKRAALGWRFRPARNADNQPVATKYDLEFTF